MKFDHRFTVKAPLSEVVEFHRHATGLKALTPPLAFMRFHSLPDPIQQGDVLSFSMWLGPVPIHWESSFPEFSANGFVDTQGKGPFRSWTHRHTFTELKPGITEVRDQIEAHLDANLWRGLVGLLMWLTLPALFLYRKMQTRRLLESSAR
jgi:ligand-binding SRPBCC domain-containing protein